MPSMGGNIQRCISKARSVLLAALAAYLTSKIDGVRIPLGHMQSITWMCITQPVAGFLVEKSTTTKQQLSTIQPPESLICDTPKIRRGAHAHHAHRQSLSITFVVASRTRVPSQWRTPQLIPNVFNYCKQFRNALIQFAFSA